MESFVQAIISFDPSTPEGKQSEEKLVRLKEENPVLFVQFLSQIISNPNLIQPNLLSRPLVFARSVLPSRIPIHGNPIVNFPNELIDSLLESLYTNFFSYSADDTIRLHAAVTFGHFAMFRLQNDISSNNYLQTLVRPFIERAPEPLISSCATALDRILREIYLDFDQKAFIFNSTFAYICDENASNIARSIVVSFLGEFMSDMHKFFGSNPPFFAQNLIKLSMNPLIADTVFFFLSKSVNQCYQLFAFMDQIIEISQHYLSDMLQNTDLILNILRLWIKLALVEANNSECFHLVAKAMNSHFPLFINIFASSCEDSFCTPLSEWNFYTASYTVIARFCQVDLEQSFQILRPLFCNPVSFNTPPIVSLHCTYCLLMAGKNDIGIVAYEYIQKALQSPSPVLQNHGLMILYELFALNNTSSSTDPSNSNNNNYDVTNYLPLCMSLLASNDTVLCQNASNAIMHVFIDFIDIHELLGQLFHIASNYPNSFSAATAIDTIHQLLRMSPDDDLGLSMFPSFLQYAHFLMEKHPTDDTVSSLLLLMGSVLAINRNRTSNEFVESAFKFAESTIQTPNCSTAFKLYSVLIVTNEKMLSNFADPILRDILNQLKEPSDFQAADSALQTLVVLIPRCQNRRSFANLFIEQCFSLLANSDISHFVAPNVFTALSTIIFYCPENASHYSMDIISVIDVAADVMLQPAEDDRPVVSYVSSVTECTALMLKYSVQDEDQQNQQEDLQIKHQNDQLVMEKMVKVALKVVDEVGKLGFMCANGTAGESGAQVEFSHGLLLGIIDVLRLLAGIVEKELMSHLVGRPDVSRIVAMAAASLTDQQLVIDANQLIQFCK